MRLQSILILLGSLLLSPGQCAPSSQSVSGAHISKSRLMKRGEPATSDSDLPDSPNHPNQLDKVETAFFDALTLVDCVLRFGFTMDEDIFLKYFAERDREMVKEVFLAVGTSDGILPPDRVTGNDLLDEILVQTTDDQGICAGPTLAYFQNQAEPFIVLCPVAFEKKAVSALKGADPEDPVAEERFYITCDDLGNTVSYLMNSLGATLLHEYM